MKRHVKEQRRYGKLVRGLVICLGLVSLLATPSFNGGRATTWAKADSSPAGYVNPLMGTAGQGNTFPGAVSPFGMAQWSPDTDTVPPRKTQYHPQSGYNYADPVIRGFSLTHISGAGCATFGDFPFLPYVGAITSSPGTNGAAYSSPFSHANETATAGYYSVLLDKPGVKVELTVTPRTGFGQFTYPASTASTMIINTGGSLNGDKGASIQIDPIHQQVSGWALDGNFCGQGNYFKIYFVAQFSAPFIGYGTWNGGNVNIGSTSSQGPVSGGYMTFDTTQNAVVQVKVGLSYVSTQNALLNMQTENPGWDFNGTTAADVASWNTSLGQIQVNGGSVADTQVFYTSLYHALLFPNIFSDVNSQYTGFDRNVYTTQPGHAQYANFSGWDIYRTQIPLLAMMYPFRTSDMMQSLVNDYEQTGCLPKWPVANTNTDVMDGDSADPILASAYAFGATNFDTATALQAMLKGATQACSYQGYKERQGLDGYLQHNYVPMGSPGVVGPASATLEYSVDDFAISRLAQALGDTQDFQTFSQRAQNWQNVYDASTSFIRPRNNDGSFFSPFNPHSLKGYDENDAYQYSWMVPYNLQGLFTDMGGNAAVISRLNTYFTQLNANGNSQYADLSNEPCLSSVWSYDYVQQPWSTQEVTRQAITSLYSSTPGGMPGNDDLGTMGAFVVWSDLGLFPQYAGVGDLVLGSPLFPQVTLKVGFNSSVLITAQNAGDNTPYIQSMQVNGQASTQLWAPLSTLSSGASLTYVMGSSPNTSWGINSSDAPPSFPAGS